MKHYKYTITSDCLHIENSYLIHEKKDMEVFLKDVWRYAVTHEDDYSIFSKRSIKSMIEEWRSHNLCYDLHLFRSRTKDVDINNPSKGWLILYKICSWFYVP